MNIILPEEFTRYDESGQKKIVFIENGILYMRNDVSFKSLMRDLTYAIYGKDICRCCNKRTNSNNITVDHIIPQDYGGPDTTNNLIPYCRECNGRKANLMPEQYSRYLEIEEPKERLQFEKECIAQNKALRYDTNFSHLYSEEDGVWVRKMSTDKIVVVKEGVKYQSERKHTKKINKQAKYKKVAKFYSKYRNFQKPIIVDKKYHLLGGYETLKYAEKIGLKEVPVIILDNVEVIY